MVGGVENLVPECVQLVHTVVVGQREQICTLVASRVLLVVAAFAVEGLVDVTNVMDQQTEGVGLRQVRLSRVKAVLDVLVDVAGEVVVAIVAQGEPLHDVHDSVGQVVVRLRELIDTGLLDVRIVDKVEV